MLELVDRFLILRVLRKLEESFHTFLLLRLCNLGVQLLGMEVVRENVLRLRLLIQVLAFLDILIIFVINGARFLSILVFNDVVFLVCNSNKYS